MGEKTNRLEIELKGESLILLPEKAIYWKRQATLLFADLHLGKTAHFRNNGIAVPKKVAERNWQLLHQLFLQFQPQKVCFLGDLFHSVINEEWQAFAALVDLYPDIQFQLVIGNHDILDPDRYTELGFEVMEELKAPPFSFTHEPIEGEGEYYNLSGHIHPAVKLRGNGKQSHRVPCFYFGEKQGILPAFGAFTGMATIQVEKTDRVFVVVNEQVFEV